MAIFAHAQPRWLVVLVVGAIVGLACTAPQSTAPDASAAAKPPQTVEQSTAPAAPKAAASTAPGLPAANAGPNLLAKNWSERLGVTVSELRPATGKALITPKAGDLYFFSNSSTAWGATNTKNAVWVIDAKTKATVAEISPYDGEKNSSHGLAVSGDGKYIYLPQLGNDNHVDVMDGRTFEVVQTIRTLGRPHHWKLWEDPVTKKAFVIGEDFNWNFTGSGFYVFDPSQGNAVVGGLSNGDFEGNPYVSTPSPDGKFIYVTVPAPMSSFRDKMDGYLGKVDTKTWKVVGIVPMVDPLWAEVSLDGKYAYVTSGAGSKVHKIETATMADLGIVQTGPGPWGARISYDQTKLYTADKGEGPGYNQQGHTSTIIDLGTMGVSSVVNIGLTTDHALLSPDGREIWYTSNADHAIYVLDTATDKISSVIQDPADGDIHGGVWVQYKDDGAGKVVGEVVADYAGLHGSALRAQIDYVASPAVTIAINGSGFLQKSVILPMDKSVRVTIKNVGSTGTGKITFDSTDLGIAGLSLNPGQAKEIIFKAPAKPQDLSGKTNKAPNGALTISVIAPAAAPVQAPGVTGPREIQIATANFQFLVRSVEVKAGEAVKITLQNGDDEKHNLVAVGNINLVSPDIAAGTTASFSWTAPQTPGTYRVICAYHPQMTFDLVIK